MRNTIFVKELLLHSYYYWKGMAPEKTKHDRTTVLCSIVYARLLCLEFFSPHVVVVVIVVVVGNILVTIHGWHTQLALFHDLLKELEVGLFLDLVEGRVKFLRQLLVFLLDFIDLHFEVVFRLLDSFRKVMGDLHQFVVRLGLDGSDRGLFGFGALADLEDAANGLGDVFVGKSLHGSEIASTIVVFWSASFSPLQGWESFDVELFTEGVAIGGGAVDLTDEGNVVSLKGSSELVPVGGHGLAVSAPRRKELDKDRFSLGHFLIVLHSQFDGVGARHQGSGGNHECTRELGHRGVFYRCFVVLDGWEGFKPERCFVRQYALILDSL
mmetsp:Transcript_32798/g.77350  ORF Transcript_32798/g.77350 Transcript_32798/m.77350 type:complete len:326 (-) Transcript_32798:24-1001(-)